MTNSQTVNLNRGSNLSWPLTLTDAGGAAVDITGWTFSIVEVKPATLAGVFTCTVTNGASGRMLLTAPWSDAWPPGVGSIVFARIKPSGLNEAFPAIVVNLQ